MITEMEGEMLKMEAKIGVLEKDVQRHRELEESEDTRVNQLIKEKTQIE